jgi:two-component system, OmpR family, sensor histidine kinase KdpD
VGCTGAGREYRRSFGPLHSPEYGEEDGMTAVAAKPAGSRIMTAEPGSWWLVLLGGLAGQAARVAEADRERAALLATVSHDLRAPLAAAKMAVSGLRADYARLTTDDRADLLAAAEESLDRLAHLAAGLLDVSRLQAGARAVFPRPAQVGEIVAAALEALGPQPKPVLADIPSGLPEVMADPAIAERVIVNLAGNALRYSPAAAPPLLTARTAGNRIELRVVDHGPGIPATDRKRVFQPFYRPGALGDSTGVGLGLAVARGLAEMMGGTVEPEDTPGGGLTMVLTLPARSAVEPRGTRRIRAA